MNFEERTNSRIIAMMAIYAYDINKSLDLEATIKMIEENFNLNERDGKSEINYDKEFLNKLANGVVENIKDLDYKISLVLDNYTIDSLSAVDRSIIRLGAYEILYVKTPKNIVINEMVNVAKVYSEIEGFKASKFDNAVLDKIANS